MHGTPSPLYIKHFSTDLPKSQEGSEQKWGGPDPPIPPRGDATELDPMCKSVMVVLRFSRVCRFAEDSTSFVTHLLTFLLKASRRSAAARRMKPNRKRRWKPSSYPYRRRLRKV